MVSLETLKKHAVGRVNAGPWEEIEQGEFVEYFGPMIDSTYVRDPLTGRQTFMTEVAAIAGAERYQAKVREHLASNSKF